MPTCSLHRKLDCDECLGYVAHTVTARRFLPMTAERLFFPHSVGGYDRVATRMVKRILTVMSRADFTLWYARIIDMKLRILARPYGPIDQLRFRCSFQRLVVREPANREERAKLMMADGKVRAWEILCRLGIAHLDTLKRIEEETGIKFRDGTCNFYEPEELGGRVEASSIGDTPLSIEAYR